MDKNTGPWAALMFTAMMLRGALDRKSWRLAQRHVNSIRESADEALHIGQINRRAHDRVIAKMNDVQKNIDAATKSKRKPRYNPGIEDDPVGGIWYYVWLKPRWEFVILHGEDKLHVDMWADHIIPLLKKKYKLTAKQGAKLRDFPYSMPRGRVTELTEGGESVFMIRHGDDFPKGLRAESELKKIVAHFGLTNRVMLGHVETIIDPHETMVQEECEDLEAIIGSVPY